jgi:hypothetical protein
MLNEPVLSEVEGVKHLALSKGDSSAEFTLERTGCVAIGFTEGLSCWLSHQNYKDLFDGQQQIFFTPILAKTQAFSSCH